MRMFVGSNNAAMQFLTESQAEAQAAKIKLAPLSDEQEFAIAKRFAEKNAACVARFLTGYSSSLRSEFRRFRKDEMESMRFDAWKKSTGARWDNQHCRFVIYCAAA